MLRIILYVIDGVDSGLACFDSLCLAAIHC